MKLNCTGQHARPAWLILCVSIFFAALMLIMSYLLRGSEHRETVVFSLVALWWIPYSFLACKSGKRCGASC